MIHKAATVLLIDDSPEDRHAYKAFLSQQQDCLYTFLEADDGEEGLRITRKAQIDLILLDFELPDLNGLDVLERLRDGADGPPTPVVMMTGRGNEEIAVQALQAGALDYLVKSSVDASTLYRVARNALERAELSAQLSKEKRDREAAEDELRESEARFRLLVESVKDHAIVMLDLEGRIASWNAGARAMFGYHDKEVLGQHYRRLFTPEDARAKVPEHELLAAERQQRTSEERWHVRKDGTTLWTVGSVFPVTDGSGARRGYSKVLRDITDRRHTVLQLQQALQARDEFLQVASHELRTPVSGLLVGTGELLRTLEAPSAPEAPQLRERVSELKAQVERLAASVDSLLDVSRLSELPPVRDPNH